MLALMISYPTYYQKKFQDAYEFLDEKSRSEKRKELFFVNPTYTITLSDVIYMYIKYNK